MQASDPASGLEVLDDQVCRFIHAHGRRVDVDLRVLRRLVGRVDSREIGQLASASLGIEALAVAPLGLCEAGVDEDLDEVRIPDLSPGSIALAPERGDEAGQDDQARVEHQRGHMRHPSQVFDAVGVSEPEVPVEPVPDVVPIKQIGVALALGETLVHRVGDR